MSDYDYITRAAAMYLGRPGGYNLWPADALRISAEVLRVARPLIERERDALHDAKVAAAREVAS